MIKVFATFNLFELYSPPIGAKADCSGLMEKDTLMRDNIIVTDRGVYERETSLQTLYTVV